MNYNPNKLTKKEQASTATYKIMSEKINSLEQSLKKTQDESEIIRQDKHELDKKLVLLDNKLEKKPFIEFVKFLSSFGVGLSINYLTSGPIFVGIVVGVASLIIFLFCTFVS